MKVKKIKNKSKYEITLKLSQSELEALQSPVFNYTTKDTPYSSYAEFELGDAIDALEFALIIEKLTKKLSKIEIEK